MLVFKGAEIRPRRGRLPRGGSWAGAQTRQSGMSRAWNEHTALPLSLSWQRLFNYCLFSLHVIWLESDAFVMVLAEFLIDHDKLK